MSDTVEPIKRKGRPSKADLITEAVQAGVGLAPGLEKMKMDEIKALMAKAGSGEEIEPEVIQTIEKIPECLHQYIKGVRVIAEEGSNYVCDRCHLCGKEINRR